MDDKKVFEEKDSLLIRGFSRGLGQLFEEYCEHLNAGQIIAILVTHMIMIAHDIGKSKEQLLELIQALIEQIDCEDLRKQIEEAKNNRVKE